MIVELLLFVIAGVICYRFFKVLGQRPENEAPRKKPNYISLVVTQGVWGKPLEKTEDKVASPLLDFKPSEEDAASRHWVDFIQQHDPAFDAAHFLGGAAKAFAMITQAFCKGDKQTLKSLLMPTVYKSFVASMDEREAAKQQEILDALTVESVTFQDVDVKAKALMIQVLIISQQRRVTLDSHGDTIEPNEGEEEACQDLWTFRRVIEAEDPVWYLAQTESFDEVV